MERDVYMDQIKVNFFYSCKTISQLGAVHKWNHAIIGRGGGKPKNDLTWQGVKSKSDFGDIGAVA